MHLLSWLLLIFGIAIVAILPYIGMINQTYEQVVITNQAPRVSVKTNDNSNALELIPKFLHSFINSQILTTSNIQLLDFVSETLLQYSMQFIENYTDLEFITREYNLTALPHTADGKTSQDVIDSILNDLHLQPHSTPNDPFYKNNSQYFTDIINLTHAWKYTTGIPEIIVAVVDTGTDISHIDLKYQLWTNQLEEHGTTGIDDDNNGYIDDIHGYDFEGECSERNPITNKCIKCSGRPLQNSVTDLYTHGTHVSGIIGAAQNNKLGTTGVAPNVKLMILKVSDCTNGVMTNHAIFKAFDYAYKMGAHIIQCSFGNSYAEGFFPLSDGPEYRKQNTAAFTEALRPLSDKGSIIIASAGNENIDLDNLKKHHYDYAPCLVELPNLLCIGATTHLGQKWQYSNYGNNVHLYAPGFEIYSTYIQDQWGPLNGTSMATPVTSGTAALLGSLNQTFNATDVKKSLLASANLQDNIIQLNSGKAAEYMMNILQYSVPSLDPVELKFSILYPTLQVTYHQATGGPLSPSIDGQILSTSIRPISGETTFVITNNFKFVDATVVRHQGFVFINKTGSWSITTNSDSIFIYVNCQFIQQTFIAQNIGWYQFEIRIAFPNQNNKYTTNFNQPVQLYSVSQERVLKHGFSASMSTAWNTVINDNVSAVDNIKDIPSNSKGTADIFLIPRDNKRNVTFRISCGGCQLYLNDVMIADAYQPFITGRPTTIETSCISLESSYIYKLSVEFDTISTISLLFKECCDCTTPFRELNANFIYSPFIWSTSYAMVAQTTGVQCDLYEGDNTIPTYKYRFGNNISEVFETDYHVICWFMDKKLPALTDNLYVNGEKYDEQYTYLESDYYNLYEYEFYSNTIQLNVRNSKLPITGIARENGIDIWSNKLVVGALGANTKTVWINDGQTQFVKYDTSEYFDDAEHIAENHDVEGQGLGNVVYFYQGIQGPNPRYTVADGYFYVDRNQVEFVVHDESFTISSIVMGDVTVYDHYTQNTAVLQTIPFTQISTKVTTISCRQDGGTSYNISTVGVGPWDKWQWARIVPYP